MPTTKPDRFFGELSGWDVNLLISFAIVPVGAVIPAIAKMVCYYSVIVPPVIVVGLIAPFVGWFLCAGAFYALSIFLGGVGSFKQVFEFAGYVFILQIPFAILCRTSVYVPVNPAPHPTNSRRMRFAITGSLFSVWGVAMEYLQSNTLAQPLDQ